MSQFLKVWQSPFRLSVQGLKAEIKFLAGVTASFESRVLFQHHWLWRIHFFVAVASFYYYLPGVALGPRNSCSGPNDMALSQKWLLISPNKVEVKVFLELSCFFDDPADVGNLISGSSAFSKTSLLSHVQLSVTPWTVCSPPGSSVHGISQARILELGAISFSRGSSQTRYQTCVSCIGRWILHC